jgi:hypothetical protein
VAQAVGHLHCRDVLHCIQDASDEPLIGEDWIAAIGKTFQLARGAAASLVQSDLSLLQQLEAWRAEIAAEDE